MEELELQKLDIKQPIKQPTPQQPMKRKRKIVSTRRTRIIAGVLALLLVFTVFMGYKAKTIYGQAQVTQAQAKVAYDALKQQNIQLAKDELIKTKTEVEKLKKEVDSIGFIGYVPVVGWYVRDVQHLVNAGNHGVSAAITTADSLVEYADVLGLKGQGTFAGSAQDRIRLAVKSLGKIVPRIDDIEKDIVNAQKEIDQVNPSHYPNVWKFKTVRAQIQQVKDLANAGVYAVEEGKPLIKVLPQLLGESEERKYLVIFQNDKELRPTGGFITFYATFRVEAGVIHLNTASDIYDLDASVRSKPTAPRIILDYLPKVPVWHIRDSNLSPDFKTSMDQFMEFYETSSLEEEVDGIIALDTHFLVHVLDILGEVQASGLTFHSGNDPRCNCPQAVYVLEDQTTRPVGYVKEDRKGLLGRLLNAIMDKALSGSASDYWGPLVQQGIKDAQEKHIVFYLFNKDAQQGIEALNWGGRVRAFDGDYLHINDANFAGAKSNLFVRQQVRVDYETKDGKIQKKVTIDYKNPQKHSDCNLESGGLCLNATLRNFQRVYVTTGSDLIDVKGSQVKTKEYEELEKQVYESFLTVDPLGKAQIVYTYSVPDSLVKDKELPVLIQKQPGTYDTPYEIYVNGKLMEKFELKTDKELKVKI